MKRGAPYWLMALFATAALLLACGADSSAAPQVEQAQSQSFSSANHVRPTATAEPQGASMASGLVIENEMALTEGIYSAPGEQGAPGFDASFDHPGNNNLNEDSVRNNGDTAGKETLRTVQRQVISTAELEIEVESVELAMGQARDIVEDVGGFLEQLYSSGGSESPGAQLTLRVPPSQFEAALDQIEKLGDVQSRNLGSEDVTDQFIDLSARLRSSQREEESLLSLLEKSVSVTEILTVERELTRVRTDIERLQGQLNFLERRVDLATIRLNLYPPGARLVNPPVANYTMSVSDISGRVDQLKDFVGILEGEIDQVYLATYADEERGEVVFRVFVADFDRTANFIEDQGRVELRELREGINLAKEEELKAKRPNARIEVTYVDRHFQFQPWLIFFILLILLAAAGGVAFVTRIAYRRGRIRGRFF